MIHRIWKYWAFDACRAYGAMVLGASISAMLGHLFNKPQFYRWWPNDPGMSMPAAIVCFLTGIVLMNVLDRVIVLERKQDGIEITRKNC